MSPSSRLEENCAWFHYVHTRTVEPIPIGGCPAIFDAAHGAIAEERRIRHTHEVRDASAAREAHLHDGAGAGAERLLGRVADRLGRGDDEHALSRGGLLEDAGQGIARDAERHAELAVEEARLVL